MILGRGMVVTTDEGPKLVSELASGESVLVVRAGVLTFVKERSVDHSLNGKSELIRLCSSAGDVSVGPADGVVAAAGVLTAADLQQRFLRAFSNTAPIRSEERRVGRD